MSRKIESQKVTIDCKAEKVYTFLSNFDNFESLLPEQVDNWVSTGDTCSFEVKGLATLGLRIVSKVPFSHISMIGEGKIPFNFSLDTHILEVEQEKCLVQSSITAEMNPFIAMVAEKPLQTLVEQIVVKLKFEMEK
jgi:carbon monoxide dehydrogenase subunit G